MRNEGKEGVGGGGVLLRVAAASRTRLKIVKFLFYFIFWLSFLEILREVG